jgi:2-polyprenyl-3-methyl-5-hydroxy-6-metoxy-1,4-benzoquinol methylase
MGKPSLIHCWENGPQRHALKYARALNALANEKIKTVLDVGAGDGIVSTVIGEGSGAAYHGIDVGAPIYSRSDNVRYVDTSAGILSALSEMGAEAVLSLDMLEHTEDFQGFARALFLSSQRLVMISLPNEMSIHVRIAFLSGKCIPCHGLSMTGAKEGHRHRWLISYLEAKALFSRLAAEMKYEQIGEVFITTLPRTLWKRLLLKPFLALLPLPLRSHGFAFVFERTNSNSSGEERQLP